MQRVFWGKHETCVTLTMQQTDQTELYESVSLTGADFPPVPVQIHEQEGWTILHLQHFEL